MRAKNLLFAVPIVFAGLAGAAVWAFRPSGPPKPSEAELIRAGIDPAEFERTRHYVTAQMELETKAQANRIAPPFSRIDDYGKSVQVGPGDRPQMVLFIKKGCPCSIDAQPLFNRLAIKFRKGVQFVGVIDKGAKDFSTQSSVVFPIVEEPSKKLMKAWDARASVYCALVARNGHIVKMWPGYSASWLKEMNALLSKASGMKETPFDPQYAPLEKTSGCPFS